MLLCRLALWIDLVWFCLTTLHNCVLIMHFAGIWQKSFHDIFDDFAFTVIFGSYYFRLNELLAKWYGQSYHVSKSNFWVPPVDKKQPCFWQVHDLTKLVDSNIFIAPYFSSCLCMDTET